MRPASQRGLWLPSTERLLKQGFDLASGFLHVDRRGHEALVYDLMECHRAEVDALVLAFLKKTTGRAGDFIKVMDGSCRAHPALAKYIKVHRRIVSHPAVGD
jgi:CRISPR/Cas system-associated endonuclease Cas1